MTREEVLAVIEKHEKLDFKELKVSYLILKPNAARHYKVIVNEIEKQQYTIIGQYAIRDYETLNMALHVEQPESMKYIIPISRMYNDFYGNYGVLLLIGKSNITYENFCLQVVSLKQNLRARFKFSYIAYAFDTAELGRENLHQKGLVVVDKDGKQTVDEYFKEKELSWCFTSMKFILLMQSVATLVKEMRLMDGMELFDVQNQIPKNIIEMMKKYKSFEHIKDMFSNMIKQVCRVLSKSCVLLYLKGYRKWK